MHPWCSAPSNTLEHNQQLESNSALLRELTTFVHPTDGRSVTSAINTNRSLPLLQVHGTDLYLSKLDLLATQVVETLLSPFPVLVRTSQRNRWLYVDATRHLLHSLAHVASRFVDLENVGISLNRNDYSAHGQYGNLAYGPMRIMTRLMAGLSPRGDSWEIMNSNPLCVVRRGVHYADVGLRTRLVPTPELKDLLVGAGLIFGSHPFCPSGAYDPSRPLLLLNGSPLNRSLTALESVLPAANELIASTAIELNLLGFSDYIRGWDFRQNRSRLQLLSAQLDRRFKGDDQSGGRLICPLQNLPRWSRHKLTFNGEQTCEFDFSACQLHLAYSSVGSTCDMVDPYIVDPSDRSGREFNKKAFVVSVGCDPDDHVGNSVSNSWHEETGKWLDSDLLRHRLEKFWTVHAPIQSLSGSEAWRHLQRVESEIALDVLGQLTAQGIPCLPLHDSFRVPCSNRSSLIAAMESAASRLSSRPKIKEVTS